MNRYNLCLIALFFLIQIACEQRHHGAALKKVPQWGFLPMETKIASDEIVHQNKSYAGIHEPGQQLAIVKPAPGSPFHITIASDATPAPVVFHVRGPVSGLVLRGQDQAAPGDTAALVKQIIAGAADDRAKADAIFRFIVDHFMDWWYPAEGYEEIQRFPRNIGLQLWGYGYGFCSDSGQIAAAMWREAGLKSKIVKLHPKHTVASVRYNGAWHLYDLQHRTYWEKSDGTIASVDELRDNSSLFHQRLNEYGLDPIAYPPDHLAAWYSDTEHRFHKSKRWDLDRDFSINLRDGESYEIHYVGRPYIYHPDMWLQYYGESTFSRNPPWPYRGVFIYNPGLHSARAQYQIQELVDGRQSLVVAMESPYLFTEGWIHVPGLDHETSVYVFANDSLHYVGPMISGKARIGKHMAGTYAFAVCLVPSKMPDDPDSIMASMELRAYTQMSHFGLPDLKSGSNAWPIAWGQGNPTMLLWYREHAGDLTVTGFESIPEHPEPGQNVKIVCTVTNQGSGPAMPAELLVFNNTTALMSESVERVGSATTPLLEPGESARISVWWVANTRQTWYDQNPYVQLFDVWLDRDKQRTDFDRSNNRGQFFIHMSKDGKPAPLPGYQVP